MERHPGPLSCGSLTPDQTLREIQVTLLECKVCFEMFNSQQKERRPQNLSCGHVLCLECITALSHPLMGKLECPFCRQLCRIEGTSHCQVLSDLEELMLSWTTHRGTVSVISARGLTSTALQNHCVFGGWGTLTNPTGIAVLPSSGTVVVVHGGEKKVEVFSLSGKKLRSFGQRGNSTGEIRYPVDVAVTHTDYIVITDAGDRAVKVFTSAGNHILSVKASFKLPWGVDIDNDGHILVSDVQAGSLSQLKMDYNHKVVVDDQTLVSDLLCPKAVAYCQVTGNVAVMEHPGDITHPIKRNQPTRLKVFSKDLHLLYLVDSFSLMLQSSVKLHMSAVAFDRNGDVIVTDSDRGLVCSLGNLHNGLVLTPLVGNNLIRPVGLALLNNMLIILDGGDHTVKIYSDKANSGCAL